MSCKDGHYQLSPKECPYCPSPKWGKPYNSPLGNSGGIVACWRDCATQDVANSYTVAETANCKPGILPPDVCEDDISRCSATSCIENHFLLQTPCPLCSNSQQEKGFCTICPGGNIITRDNLFSTHYPESTNPNPAYKYNREEFPGWTIVQNPGYAPLGNTDDARGCYLQCPVPLAGNSSSTPFPPGFRVKDSIAVGNFRNPNSIPGTGLQNWEYYLDPIGVISNPNGERIYYSNANGVGGTFDYCWYDIDCRPGYHPERSAGYYPHCERNTYTIKFDGNGSDSGSFPDLECVYEIPCILPHNNVSNGFKKPGSSFLCWDDTERVGQSDGYGNPYGKCLPEGFDAQTLTTDHQTTIVLHVRWKDQGPGVCDCEFNNNNCDGCRTDCDQTKYCCADDSKTCDPKCPNGTCCDPTKENCGNFECDPRDYCCVNPATNACDPQCTDKPCCDPRVEKCTPITGLCKRGTYQGFDQLNYHVCYPNPEGAFNIGRGNDNYTVCAVGSYNDGLQNYDDGTCCGKNPPTSGGHCAPGDNGAQRCTITAGYESGPYAWNKPSTGTCVTGGEPGCTGGTNASYKHGCKPCPPGWTTKDSDGMTESMPAIHATVDACNTSCDDYTEKSSVYSWHDMWWDVVTNMVYSINGTNNYDEMCKIKLCVAGHWYNPSTDTCDGICAAGFCCPIGSSDEFGTTNNPSMCTPSCRSDLYCCADPWTHTCDPKCVTGKCCDPTKEICDPDICDPNIYCCKGLSGTCDPLCVASGKSCCDPMLQECVSRCDTSTYCCISPTTNVCDSNCMTTGKPCCNPDIQDCTGKSCVGKPCDMCKATFLNSGKHPCSGGCISGPNAHECLLCPPGAVSNHSTVPAGQTRGPINVTPCGCLEIRTIVNIAPVAASTNNVPPRTECWYCGVGLQPNLTREYCEPCPPGTARTEEQLMLDKCMKCPPGAIPNPDPIPNGRKAIQKTYPQVPGFASVWGDYVKSTSLASSIGPAGTKCLYCGAGMYPNANHTECLPCPEGTYRNEDMLAFEVCLACPPNTVNCECKPGYRHVRNPDGTFQCVEGDCDLGECGFGTIDKKTGLCILLGCLGKTHVSADGLRCDENVVACTTTAGAAGYQEWDGTVFGTCIEGTITGTGCVKTGDSTGVGGAGGSGGTGGGSCSIANAASYAPGNNCVAATCVAGYHVDGGQCVNSTKSCTMANAVSATQTWDGGAWGACVPTACEYGYHISVDKKCIKDSQACAIENGTGAQDWNDATDSWDACYVVGCNPGFTGDPALSSEPAKPCGACSNRYSILNEIAVSSYITECEIAACMYQGELYTLDNNECVPICEPGAGRSDETGMTTWNPSTKKCDISCNAGYMKW